MFNSKTLILTAAVVLLAACGQQQQPAADKAQDAAAGAAAATDAAVEKADLTTMIANADVKQGERTYLQCRACHSLEQGGINKVGPNLFGVFDKPAGGAEGFNYSEQLLAAGVTWDVATMDKWLERPSAMVPGNRMVFVGIRDPQQRANLIAYLQQATQ